MLIALALLLALVLPVDGASAGGGLDPSFGDGGVATLPLPPEAAQKAVGILDLANGPGATAVGALGGSLGQGYFGAVRLTSAGAPDPSFGQNGLTPALGPPQSGLTQEAQAEAVALQSDGKLVVAGFLQEGLHDPTGFTPLLARYQADGSLDPEFGSDGFVLGRRQRGQGGTALHAAAIAPDGRIIAVGGRGELGGGFERPAGVVSAYKPDGSLDKTFGRNGSVLFSQPSYKAYSSLRDVEVLPDGKILVVGYHHFRLFLARLRGNGALDRRFGEGDGVATFGLHRKLCCPTASLAVQANGRIIVAGYGGPARTARVYLLRYRPAGRLDPSFGDRGLSAPFPPWRLIRASDLALQPDGGIITLGQSARTPQNPTAGDFGIFRNLPGGSVDTTFGTQGLLTLPRGELGFPRAALTRPDGSVLTAGSFGVLDPNTKRYTTTLLLAQIVESHPRPPLHLAIARARSRGAVGG